MKKRKTKHVVWSTFACSFEFTNKIPNIYFMVYFSTISYIFRNPTVRNNNMIIFYLSLLLLSLNMEFLSPSINNRFNIGNIFCININTRVGSWNCFSHLFRCKADVSIIIIHIHKIKTLTIIVRNWSRYN